MELDGLRTLFAHFRFRHDVKEGADYCNPKARLVCCSSASINFKTNYKQQVAFMYVIRRLMYCEYT